MGLSGRRYQEAGESCFMSNVAICAVRQILLGGLNETGKNGQYAVCVGEMENASKVVVGKSEDFTPLVDFNHLAYEGM